MDSKSFLRLQDENLSMYVLLKHTPTGQTSFKHVQYLKKAYICRTNTRTHVLTQSNMHARISLPPPPRGPNRPDSYIGIT